MALIAPRLKKFAVVVVVFGVVVGLIVSVFSTATVGVIVGAVIAVRRHWRS